MKPLTKATSRDDRVLATLGVDLDDGTSLWRIDARRLARGFSVVIRDGESGTRWRLARTVEPYSWQRFGRYLMSWQDLVGRIQHRVDFSWIPSDEHRFVTVSAESEEVADILRFCLSGGDDSRTRWLVGQSDESVAMLVAALPDALKDQQQSILEELAEAIEELVLPVDLSELCQHYGLEGPGVGLTALRECIASDMAADAARRRTNISKWTSEIAKLTDDIDDRAVRAGGMGFPSKRSRVVRFLEDYVGRHNRLPDGVHEIQSLGRMDFDALRREHGL